MMGKKFLPVIGVIVFVLFISACTREKEIRDQEHSDDGIKSIYVMQNEYDMLMDFEHAADVKKAIVFENQFGKVQICEDASYITNGKASARLEIIGDLYGKTESYPGMEIILERAPILKSDLSGYEAIECDMFNASDRDISVYTSIGSFTKKVYNNATSYKLKKDEWTHITIYMPTELMGDEFPVKELTSIYLWFDKPQIGESSPVLYMDSLMARKVRGKNPIQQTESKEGMIADFEKEWEMYGIRAKGAYNYKSNPVLNINSNPEYVSAGNRSLSVYAKKPFDGVSPYFGYPTLIFDQEWFPEIANIGDYEGFSLDILNRAGERRKISMIVRDTQGKTGNFWNLNLNGDCWTTVECTIEQLKEFGVDIHNIKSIELLWEEEGYFESDLDLYLDNFILKGGN